MCTYFNIETDVAQNLIDDFYPKGIFSRYWIFKTKLPNVSNNLYEDKMIVCFTLRCNIYSNRNEMVGGFFTISVFVLLHPFKYV